jgi:hypothetical protein
MEIPMLSSYFVSIDFGIELLAKTVPNSVFTQKKHLAPSFHQNESRFNRGSIHF